MNLRQDAWSDKDDRLLANTVLKHIREGSTQLKAFDETGDMLERTSAACGFRWNAIVRQKYEHKVKEAKRERKMRMRASANQAANQINPARHSGSLTIDHIITHLEGVADELDQHGPAPSEDIEKEITSLEQAKKTLQQEINEMKNEYNTMKRDYDTIVHMMNRAREMAMTEESLPASNVFRMDRNGNLEKLSI
ncbi:RsfA family transcriptional regulator [Alteribacillus bidgolensis]|uniref:Prespore-specific regulator n=1 Tax=Alteribacillus bidgolensis TaxID=930129 RepID=A0A1G8N8U1_9BACI|nr:RsfA family transcriptional regulator [Alteribacillus bidgolensis]SDI76533.1 prespore-specific regulator [Alteribacillus bidgolensis]